MRRGCCGTGPSGLRPPAGAAALQDSLLGVEAEGLPDAAQGDMKGAEFEGGIEQAVEAGIQEFQMFQEGGLAVLLFLLLLPVKVAGEMLGVAAEGRGAETELPGQGAVGDPVDEAAIDLRAGGVRTDGTAVHHNCAPGQKFPPGAGWISGYQGRGGGASTGGTAGRGLVQASRQGLAESGVPAYNLGTGGWRAVPALQLLKNRKGDSTCSQGGAGYFPVSVGLSSGGGAGAGRGGGPASGAGGEGSGAAGAEGGAG
jgi:hypothetical protein